ncbi:MAG: ABC transporter permease [Armatimonadetes bacterium]|nr:ABC transporter permease [Anaerolineae bacterium]
MTTNTLAATRPPLRARLSALLTPPFGPLLFLFIICIIFSVLPLLTGRDQRFLTLQNFALIFQQTAVVGVLAIGQTLIILTGGIDLSNGLIMALTSVITAGLAIKGFSLGSTGDPINPYLAMVLGLSVAALAGFINGTLVTRLKLPPFIVTLGTLNITFALTRIYTTSTINGLPEPLLALGEAIDVGGVRIPPYALVMLGLFFIVWFILRETRLGRHIYAVGDNREAAALVGIPVNRILIIVYTSAGLLYGIAALLLIARQENGDPQAGQTSNLESITAVVLGGTSLFGGRGHIMGTLIGALVVSIIRNGLTQQGANPIIQTLITGILVIAAVAVDQFSQRAK